MASLLGTLHFWTSKNTYFNNDANVGFYIYHGKNSVSNQQQNSTNNYNEEYKQFCEERGILWNVNNKRPEKLKPNLKELEELFVSFRCVYCDWRSRNVLLLMFNNGAIVKMWMKAGSGDVNKIRIDKYLVGKLASEHVIDVLFLDSAVLVSYLEAKLTLIQLNKRLMNKTQGSCVQFEKLSTLDPKIQTFDVNGPNRRRFERRLSASLQNDQLMVWWMSRNEESPGPWAPPSTDKEKANLHVYNINKTELQLQCYTRTKCDPINASFSRLHLNEIHTIEQSVKDREISVILCKYHVSKNRLLRTSVTTIPLNSCVGCHGMNETEDKVLLGCKDGSLVMYDAHKRTTRITKGTFIASAIRWHPSVALVMVGGEKGHLQCYDMSLNVVNMELLSETPNSAKAIDLGSYFKSPPEIDKLSWNILEYSPLDWAGYVDTTHSLIIANNKGPLGVLVIEAGISNKGALTSMELITQYVKYSQFDEAINLLHSINWNIDSELCFKCLTLITISLLKLPLNEIREGQLESCLASYYSAPHQLSEVVTLEYHHKMTCLGRRFFHHLLRNERFEKAFLLAVDIGARDLFMDIFYVAKDKNEKVLAQAALDRANQLETESDSSLLDEDSDSGSYSSTCSSSSYSSNTQEEFEQQPKFKWENEVQLKQPEPRVPPVYHQPPPAPWTPQRGPGPHVVQVSAQNDQHQNNSMNPQPSTSYTRASMKAPQVMSDISEEISEEEEIHGTVHVVHFGIV